VAALHITTLSSTPIISNRNLSLINMTAHLLKTKTVLLNHMKTLPDVHIVAREDFITWGQQFINTTVSHV
jgi:hypothetical protein